jgi:hypothetical protein
MKIPKILALPLLAATMTLPATVAVAEEEPYPIPPSFTLTGMDLAGSTDMSGEWVRVSEGDPTEMQVYQNSGTSMEVYYFPMSGVLEAQGSGNPVWTMDITTGQISWAIYDEAQPNPPTWGLSTSDSSFGWTGGGTNASVNTMAPAAPPPSAETIAKLTQGLLYYNGSFLPEWAEVDRRPDRGGTETPEPVPPPGP